MLCKEMITRSYDKVIDRSHEMGEVHNTFFEIYNLDQMLVRTIYNDEDIPNRRLLMGGIKKLLTIIPLDLENCVFKVK